MYSIISFSIAACRSLRRQRDLSQKHCVYWWADGIYFNVRLDEERSCVLVLIGATEDGNKELLAVVDGYPEKHPVMARASGSAQAEAFPAPRS
jgi:hypothetical protein